MTIRNGRSYEAYINSSAWETRRELYFASHKKQCVACGATDKIHLHHKTYDRMGAERDKDLAPLCELCHSALHRWHRELGGSLYEVSEDFIEHSSLNKKGGVQKGEHKVTNVPTEKGFVPRHLRGAKRDSNGRLISVSDWRTEARDIKASFP